MLYVRRGFGDEKSQLNELNRRLDQYLSRVRQLESENQLLVEEIHRLREERGAQWVEVYQPEINELRRKVEELTIQKCEAELQKDNLLHELHDLQELYEQVKSMRLKFEQQIAHCKQDLQQAQKNQVALEELYVRLQQEWQMLQATHEEDLLALRNRAIQAPLQMTIQEVSRPRFSLTDVQSFSIDLSESWKDTFVFYQKKIEELENTLRLSEVERIGAEEEAVIHRLQVEKLQKEYEELLAIRTMLENELLRMRGKYRLEVEEYEIIIEQLENERKNITVTIAERLKDYHDLMQVKTGLTLEVSAYRALLEAESKKGTVIVTEHTVRDRPAGYVTSAFEQTTRFPSRKLEIDYPYTKSKDTLKWKANTNVDRFKTQTISHPRKTSEYTSKGNVSSSYISHTYDNAASENSGRLDFSTRYGPLHKSEAKAPFVSYQAAQHTSSAPYAPYEPAQSFVISQTATQEQIQSLKPVARPRTHSKEARKGHANIKIESKQESDSQKAFETKAEDRVKESQFVEDRHVEDRHVIESYARSTRHENERTEEKGSVTEAAQKDTVQEPKAQELPVKKERKKREQAKKIKEELENVSVGDMKVTGDSNVEIHKSTQVKATTIFGEDAEDEKIVLEIPIKFERSKQEDNEQTRNVRHEQNVDECDITKTILQNTEEKTLVDSILRQLQQPTDASPEEKSQGGSFMRSFILGENTEKEEAVREIPIQIERSQKETSSDKHNVENVEQSSTVSVNQTKEDSLGFHYKATEPSAFSRREESESFSSESFDKKTLVSDILRQLGQPSDLDDTNVTYMERKKECSDGTTKTEILVQSKTEEEIDLFDEPDLKDLWNTPSTSSAQESGASNISFEETQSRKIKKTLLEDITGAEAEEWIGIVIHTELKGSPGKSVNVEIIEESIGTFAYDKGEFSTPFHVEEAEDNYHKEESANIEDVHVLKGSPKISDSVQPTETPARVEEITEGVHDDEEMNYFVSIPEDNLYQEEEEEETIRGQIYTEEESQLKYSWQDEFLQGSQGRKSLSEMLKQAVDLESSKTSTESTHTLDKEEQNEKLRAETIVVDRMDTYDSSSVDWDNELQKEENDGKSYVETIVIEKAATYGSSVDSDEKFENKEQKAKSHTETIIIEKAASGGSSVDSSHMFDIEVQKGESDETVVIERKITVPHEIQSSIMDLLSKDIKDPKQKLKGTIECLQGNLPQELVEELSLLAGEEQTQTSNLSMDIKKVGSTEDSVTIVAEINVSQTVDRDNIDDVDFAQGISSNYALQKEGGIGTFIKEIGRSEEIYHSATREKNTNEGKGPTTREIHISPTQEGSLGQMFPNRIIKHIEIDTSEQYITDQDSSSTFSPTEMNRSEHHIKLGPSKQIIFEGPISETFKLDFMKNTEDASEENRSIRHIRISPTESATTEQVIFQGPIFKTGGMGATHTESASQGAQSLYLEKFHVGTQGSTDQCTEFTAGASNTISHFKVNSGEAFTKQIIFEGSIPRTHELRLNTQNVEDDERPVEHSSSAQKIQVSQQIKYQGFVSEQHTAGDYGSITGDSTPTNVNTSVHHIKLSPSKEHIVFESPISANVHISGKDSTYVVDTNRSIQHIRLGSPEMHVSEHVSFEGPTTESYESSDFFVSSPSGDSTESERSIKHIKLGPQEKSFTFQMDISKVSTKYSEEGRAQESGQVITSSMFEGQAELTKPSTEFMEDTEVAESGYGEDEIAGVTQFAYKIQPHSQDSTITSELEKEVQVQRIVHQSDMVFNEKKVAVCYLDDEEDEDESDQDYLRRSF